MLCPCGSKLPYAECCALLHQHKQVAQNAEQLMRSRYSAYALKNIDYIYHTYAEATRKQQSIEDLETAAQGGLWVKLTIVKHLESIDVPEVHFKANYIEKNKLYLLEENSRFDPQENFHYIDGNILNHEMVATIKRNDNCPCDSGKKFKKCCQLKAS